MGLWHGIATRRHGGAVQQEAMNKKWMRRLGTLGMGLGLMLVLLALVTGCLAHVGNAIPPSPMASLTSAPTTPSASHTPNATETPKASSTMPATKTATPVPSTTPTASPTPLSALAGKVGFAPVQTIGAANASQVVQLANLGQRFYGTRFSPDSGRLAIYSAAGIDLFDTAALTETHLTDNAAGVVAFSPDSRWLASGNRSGALELFDLASSQGPRTLEGHSGDISALVFSPDGRWLASAGEDGLVKLWQVVSGQAVHTLSGHTRRVGSVAFSPDGKLLASGGDDGLVKLWDVASGRGLTTLTNPSIGHQDPIYDQVTEVAFSPDGQQLAAYQWDALLLWSLGSGQIAQHWYDVASKALSPDWKTLASVNMTNGMELFTAVTLWDTTRGKNLQVLPDSQNVETVAFSADGKRLALEGLDNTIKLWDTVSGRVVQTLTTTSLIGPFVEFSPNGRLLATLAAPAGELRVWDIASGRVLLSLKSTPEVSGVAFSPDGQTLAAGSWEDIVNLWDIVSGQVRLTLPGHRDYAGLLLSVAFSPDGKWIAAGEPEGYLTLWDAASGQELQVFRSGVWAEIESLAFSPDSQIVASAESSDSSDAPGQVKLWSVTTGQLLRTLSHSVRGWVGATFSPTQNALAAASGDGSVVVWDTISGREQMTLTIPQASSVAFSPDGRLLAIGSWDDTISLVEAATGQKLRTLQGHVDAVDCAAFSPDGTLLASGSQDGMIILWEVASGRKLTVLAGHQDHVTGLSFSQNGRLLASSSWDGTVRLWGLKP